MIHTFNADSKVPKKKKKGAPETTPLKLLSPTLVSPSPIIDSFSFGLLILRRSKKKKKKESSVIR